MIAMFNYVNNYTAADFDDLRLLKLKELIESSEGKGWTVFVKKTSTQLQWWRRKGHLVQMLWAEER